MTDVTLTANSESDLNSDLVTAATEGSGTNVTITFGSNITESGQLNAINLASGVSLTLNGQGHTLDGASVYQGLFVYSGDVTIEKLTIQNAVAKGGPGGSGSSGGGGGGAGLGGGLFVAGTGDREAVVPVVNLQDVSFGNDAAIGGAGASTSSTQVYGGGGGGLGGAGGAGGGGVGLQAIGANGGSVGASGSIIGASSAAPGLSGQAGGANGGGGGGTNYESSTSGAGGGGVGASGSRGGFGGGAGSALTGKTGGFGGGGSSGYNGGGNGGFGGGGGGRISNAAGAGGFGAGSGVGGGGGGGLGAGGDIFVQQGATLILEGGTMSGGAVTGGAGASSPGNGYAYGSGVFIQGNQTVTFASQQGVSYVSDVIADQTGSGAVSANAGAGAVLIGYSSTQNGMTTVAKGTVIFTAAETYTGATTLDYGTLALSGGGSIAASSGVAIAGGATLDVSSATNAPTIQQLSDATGGSGTAQVKLGQNTLTVNEGAVASFSGTITDGGLSGQGGGSLVIQGAGALTLAGVSTYSGSTTIAAGSALVLSAGGAGSSLADTSGVADQGVLKFFNATAASFGAVISGAGTVQVRGSAPLTLTAVETYTHHTQVTGVLDLSGAGSIASAKDLSLQSSGAVFDTSGASAGESIGSLDGVTGSVVYLGSHALTVDQTTAATFAGVISNGGVAGGVGGGLVVDGTAALTLTAAQAYTGKTQIHGELDLSGGGALGSSKAVVLKEAGAVFDISGVNRPETILNLAGVAGSHIDLGANGLKVNQSTAANYSGVISDGGVDGGTGSSLTVKGTATLTLSGHNTFTGGLKLIGGEVELAASNAAGSNNHDVTFSGAATLEIDAAALSGSTNAHSFANAIDGFAASDTIDLSSLAYVSGSTSANFVSGDLIVSNGTSQVTLFLNDLASTQTFTVISDMHGGALVEEASGAVQANALAASSAHHVDLFGI